MSNKAKRDSSLVKTVLALDNYLSELERIGTKINSTDLNADFDFDYIQKLMARFAECGQGISDEVANLSKELQAAQARGEAVAQGVGKQAELLKIRRKEQDEKLEEFRVLGEKARDLNMAIMSIDRANIAASVASVESQLSGLIEELEHLRNSARDSRMKALERNAQALVQSLQAVRKKLQNIA